MKRFTLAGMLAAFGFFFFYAQRAEALQAT
jgi:hypothetical protein